MDVPVAVSVGTAKILIVDDKEQNIISIESILEQDGYSFTRAYSGKEALKILLKEDDFALILMDVNMPEMNGYETASLIYKREKLKHIPVIFITSFDYSEENAFKGYKSGGVDYIFKPINHELLKIKVRIFVELFAKNRQLMLHEEKLKGINKELEKKINENLAISEQLKQRNTQLMLGQKLTHIGNWQWNLLSNRISGSGELNKIYEIPSVEGEFTVDQMLGSIHPDDLPEVKDVLANTISNGGTFDLYFRVVTGSGDIRYVNKKGSSVKNAKDELISIYGTCQDVTGLKLAEEQLKIFNMLEKVLNEIYIIDAATYKINYANTFALKNLGFPLTDLRQQNFFDLIQSTDVDKIKKCLSDFNTNPSDKIIQFGNFVRKDKSYYPAEIHLQLINERQSQSILAVVQDLTERKKTELFLSESLKEKETLLKEIHHRVKNNLQIIYSLISLQCSSTTDQKVIGILKESQNRIRSMALVHEKLYQGSELSKLDFAGYIKELVESMLNIYDLSGKVKIYIDAQKIELSIDLAISLGLCVTELVSNSFKYAFPEGDSEGEICVRLYPDNKNINLIISDNGVGLPKDFDITSTDSLGLKIVSALVAQHNGVLKVSNGKTTDFSISIPAAPAKF